MTALPVATEPRQALSLVLSEEVPVVHLQVQPDERVTLDVHPVAGEERVTTTRGEERVELTDFPGLSDYGFGRGGTRRVVVLVSTG